MQNPWSALPPAQLNKQLQVLAGGSTPKKYPLPWASLCHVTHSVAGLHNYTCKMRSKSLKSFKQGARLWLKRTTDHIEWKMQKNHTQVNVSQLPIRFREGERREKQRRVVWRHLAPALSRPITRLLVPQLNHTVVTMTTGRICRWSRENMLNGDLSKSNQINYTLL